MSKFEFREQQVEIANKIIDMYNSGIKSKAGF